MTDRWKKIAEKQKDLALPEIGSAWLSHDPRDQGILPPVVVLNTQRRYAPSYNHFSDDGAYDPPPTIIYVRVKRFNRSWIRLDCFYRQYHQIYDCRGAYGIGLHQGLTLGQ